MKHQVRYITQSDIEGFAEVLSSVVRERKFLLTIDTPSLDDISEFVRSTIEQNYAQYVAVVDGRIVGWADIIPRRQGAVRHSGELGIGVAADYRGRGIGGDLLKNVIRHSWEIGLTRLELEVISSNQTAIALYEHHGFQHEGIKHNGWFVDGLFKDILVMAQYRIQPSHARLNFGRH